MIAITAPHRTAPRPSSTLSSLSCVGLYCIVLYLAKTRLPRFWIWNIGYWIWNIGYGILDEIAGRESSYFRFCERVWVVCARCVVTNHSAQFYFWQVLYVQLSTTVVYLILDDWLMCVMILHSFIHSMMILSFMMFMFVHHLCDLTFWEQHHKN